MRRVRERNSKQFSRNREQEWDRHQIRSREDTGALGVCAIEQRKGFHAPRIHALNVYGVRKNIHQDQHGAPRARYAAADLRSSVSKLRHAFWTGRQWVSAGSKRVDVCTGIRVTSKTKDKRGAHDRLQLDYNSAITLYCEIQLKLSK